MSGSESYLQMIQANITRLAGQSTTVKGWCVTLTAALLGYGATAADALVSALSMYVIITFAVLDAYYLTLERAFRALFATASANTTPSWDLTPAAPTIAALLQALRSPAIAILYGSSLTIAAVFTLHALRT